MESDKDPKNDPEDEGSSGEGPGDESSGEDPGAHSSSEEPDRADQRDGQASQGRREPNIPQRDATGYLELGHIDAMERFLREVDLDEFKQALGPTTGWAAQTQADHGELETVDMILEDIRQGRLHSDDQTTIENYARATLPTLDTLQKEIMVAVTQCGIVQENYDRGRSGRGRRSDRTRLVRQHSRGTAKPT